jgi:cytoskeletal protein CcmA (bactofilin family)
MTVLLAALALGGCADGTIRGVLVFDGSHVVRPGESVQGDLVVLAGEARVSDEAVVEGSVWVLGGFCQVAGRVHGDVTGFAGRLSLAETANVAGDVLLAGVDSDVAEGAHVGGEVTEALSDVVGQGAPPGVRLRIGLQLALLLGVVALVLGRWWPRPLERVGDAAVRHPVASLATGVMAGVTGLVVLVLVGFTLVLLPLAVLMALGGLMAVALGWVGLAGHVAGRAAPAMLPRSLAIGLSTAVLVLAVTLLALVPFAGGILALALASWGLGAVLLTRVGSRDFRPAAIDEVDEGANESG